MQKAKRVGGKLIWANGNILNDEVWVDPPSKKYYAVVVMCGHVGDGYFVPILFQVQAKDMESAKLLVKNFPRVKNQIKDCILGIKEISRIEDYFIKTINLHDSYITHSRNKALMSSRIIMTPDKVKKELEKARNKPKNKLWDLDSTGLYIKLAEDYAENYVLQRYFAPRKQGKKIIFPRHVDMDLLLGDYFVERTKALGLGRQVVPILVTYYKVFGADNPLGVTICDEKVSFVGNDGRNYSLDLDDFSLSLLNLEDETRLVDALKAKRQSPKENFEALEGQARTGMERFHDKWQKTKNLQNRKNKE